VHLGEKNFPCPDPDCNLMFGKKQDAFCHNRLVHLRE
jgi:hypothetical protein